MFYCAKKLDPAQVYTTEAGFKFRFPMSGDWYPGSSQNGMYVVGQKVTADGTSKLAVVRHGILEGLPNGRTNTQFLNSFRSAIENEAKGGRVNKVKNNFTHKNIAELTV